MQQSLLLCITFLLTLASIKVEALNISSEAYCPLNISAEFVAHPWMLHQCSGTDKSHCCEGIFDLIKILLFSWMHTTRSFLLPTNHTADICLNEFQRQLEARAGIGAELFNSCHVRSESFVSDSGTCLGIHDVSSFESRVYSSGMKLNCNGSGPGVFQCSKCLRAMAMALHSLNERSGNKSNCPLFVMIYVGGGINFYDGLGPDATFCLQSPQNLTSLAAYAEQRSRAMKL